MSWRQTHGPEWKVDPWFEQHMEDVSYRNDLSPSFEIFRHTTGDGPAVRVWVGHPDPDLRADEGGIPPYQVEAQGPGSGEYAHATDVQTPAEAVWHIRYLARRYGLPVPPPYPGQPDTDPEYRRALRTIQRHRQTLGERPLDPGGAGWTREDVILEARRIGNPSSRERMRDLNTREARERAPYFRRSEKIYGRLGPGDIVRLELVSTSWRAYDGKPGAPAKRTIDYYVVRQWETAHTRYAELRPVEGQRHRQWGTLLLRGADSPDVPNSVVLQHRRGGPDTYHTTGAWVRIAQAPPQLSLDLAQAKQRLTAL